MRNSVLAGLLAADYEHVLPKLGHVRLTSGRTLYQADHEIADVYFPEDSAPIRTLPAHAAAIAVPRVIGTDSAFRGCACASAPTRRLMSRTLAAIVPDVHGPKLMNPLTSFLVFAFVAAGFAAGYFVNLYVAIALFACAVLIASSLKMANVWQKFVILRLGKLQSVRGAGLFAIIPVLDTAESALTKDTVPCDRACGRRLRRQWVVGLCAR
jgi:hypothetical protein